MKFILLTFAGLLVVTTGLSQNAPRLFALEERMMERARNIIIPSVEFKDVTLADALEVLRQEARKYDTKHEGVVIVADLKPMPQRGHFPGLKKELPPPPGGWPLHTPLDDKISVSLHNVSLERALRLVAGDANCHAVPSKPGISIIRYTESTESLLTYTIPLPRELFGKGAKPERFGVRSEIVAKLHTDPKNYFEEQGIQFPFGSSCSFEDNGMTLLITNTMDNLWLVDTLLEDFVPRQRAKKTK